MSEKQAMTDKFRLIAALSCFILIPQAAFAQSPITSAPTVDGASIDAVLADGLLMDKLNAENGPTVECMIGALASVYRPIRTAEQGKAWAANVQEAGTHCGLRAQAARTMPFIKAKFSNLSDDQAAQVGGGLIVGQVLIGVALEYGKNRHL